MYDIFLTERMVWSWHSDAVRTTAVNQQFFPGYRKTGLRPDEILTHLMVPLSSTKVITKLVGEWATPKNNTNNNNKRLVHFASCELSEGTICRAEERFVLYQLNICMTTEAIYILSKMHYSI